MAPLTRTREGGPITHLIALLRVKFIDVTSRYLMPAKTADALPPPLPALDLASRRNELEYDTPPPVPSLQPLGPPAQQMNAAPSAHAAHGPHAAHGLSLGATHIPNAGPAGLAHGAHLEPSSPAIAPPAHPAHGMPERVSNAGDMARAICT